MGQPWMLLRAAAILLVTRQTLALSDIFEEGKSDKEILDNLLRATRYDKRLLPPVRDADFCCGLRSPEDANNDDRNIRLSGKQRGPCPNMGQPWMLLRAAAILLVTRQTLALSDIFEEGKSDKEILDNLLRATRYDKRLLPPQQWYDPRLRYSNQSEYNYLNAIHHHDDIWLPDTYFIMHGDFKDPLIPVHFSLRIYRNGSVNYLMRQVTQFIALTVSYEITSINYVWKNDEDVLRKSPSLTTLNAYLINNQTLICPIQSSW
ncbi:hypothetical protein HUJ04_009902, partial [Dendroctonus ponderosae]